MRKTLLTFLIGACGGIFGAMLVTATPLNAAIGNARYSQVEVYNAQGSRTGFLGSGSIGQGVVFIADDLGNVRLQMGSYDTGEEQGQALLGMHDRLNNLRLLFRLFGPEDSPTVILKDKSGQDQIVMGLEGKPETPYFLYRNSKGQMVSLLK